MPKRQEEIEIENEEDDEDDIVEDAEVKAKIADLVKRRDTELASTKYINTKEAKRLVGILMQSYRDSLSSPRWDTDEYLKQAAQGARFGIVLAAVFDLVTNIEYYHGRVKNSNWIYCTRKDIGDVRAFYVALKQCPRCCLDKGLTKRISGAQHKPSSHHIGEITTTVCCILLKVIAAGAEGDPPTIAAVNKQSHDVDAVAFNDDTLVLFEMKASPMVTFPLVAEWSTMYTDAKKMATDSKPHEEERDEYGQHTLIDVQYADRDLSLYIPHRKWTIPLGKNNDARWPYPNANSFFSNVDNFLGYLSAWLEIFYAYSVPKKQRNRDQKVLAYLANGWGDEIDSNKTKPGLGRTDDIKKGTYQLLKFATYYRDVNAELRVRAALVANLDPLFLRAAYLDKLTDIRWGKGGDFRETRQGYEIAKAHLHYLYEAILAFNNPEINEPELAKLFDLNRADACLIRGDIDEVLSVWVEAKEVSEGAVF